MNKVILMGRLVADPELKTTQSGLSVTQFRLAVKRRFAKADDAVQADFIDCAAWRNTAEFVCKYFAKGQQVAVVGALQTRKWQDKDGNNRYATEVVVSEVYFAERKKDAAAVQTQVGGEFEEVDDDGDLPF